MFPSKSIVEPTRQYRAGRENSFFAAEIAGFNQLLLSKLAETRAPLEIPRDRIPIWASDCCHGKRKSCLPDTTSLRTLIGPACGLPLAGGPASEKEPASGLARESETEWARSLARSRGGAVGGRPAWQEAWEARFWCGSLPERRRCAGMICVECGQPVNNVSHRVRGEDTRLTRCEYCKKVADKYVEHELVIIFLDLVLIKPQAYRHMIFNRAEYSDAWISSRDIQLAFFIVVLCPPRPEPTHHAGNARCVCAVVDAAAILVVPALQGSVQPDAHAEREAASQLGGAVARQVVDGLHADARVVVRVRRAHGAELRAAARLLRGLDLHRARNFLPPLPHRQVRKRAPPPLPALHAATCGTPERFKIHREH